MTSFPAAFIFSRLQRNEATIMISYILNIVTYYIEGKQVIYDNWKNSSIFVVAVTRYSLAGNSGIHLVNVVARRSEKKIENRISRTERGSGRYSQTPPPLINYFLNAKKRRLIRHSRMFFHVQKEDQTHKNTPDDAPKPLRKPNQIYVFGASKVQDRPVPFPQSLPPPTHSHQSFL